MTDIPKNAHKSQPLSTSYRSNTQQFNSKDVLKLKQ